MSTFEIRAGAISIRREASDELDALEQAVVADLLHDGDEGNVYPADRIPVGLDGDDPEAG